MKPLRDLTTDDLKVHPIWEYQGTSDVDAQVSPTDRKDLREYDEGVFIAATEFKFADGSFWTGYCSPQDSSGLDYLQPVPIVEGRHVPLWLDHGQDLTAAEARWRAAGYTLDQVFPLEYKCAVQVDAQEVRGVAQITDILYAGETG